MATQLVDGEDSEWRRFSRGRVTILVTTHSPALRRMPELLDIADRAEKTLGRLLKVPDESDSHALVLRLVDTIDALAVAFKDDDSESARGGGGGDGSASSDVMTVALSAEMPASVIVRPLVAAAVHDWFGPHAVQAARIVSGLAGLVGGRLDVGPDATAADAWVRSALAAGQSVSIVVPLASALDPGQPDLAATSFVSWLLGLGGAEPLRGFLAAYDPERRDEAVLAAYQRPLGALEEAWLAGLAREAGKLAAVRAFLSYLLPLLRPYGWRQAELFVYMLLGLTYTLALPLASKYLVDSIIPSGSGRRIVVFVLVLLAIYVINALVSLRRAYVTGWISQHIMVVLAERLFAHLQRLPHSFYAKSRVGDLMARLSNDVMVVQMSMSQVIGTALYQVMTAIAVAITVLALSPLLGLLVILTIPLFAIPYVTLRSRLQAAGYEQGKLMGEAAASAQENLAAHALIKAFGLEQRVVTGYHARLTALLGASLRLMVTGALFETSMTFATSLGELIMLGVGGYLVVHGQLTIGTLLAFWGLLPTLYMPVAAISNLGQTIQKASGSIERLNEVLDEPIPIRDKADAVPLAPLAGEIRFDDVSFGYDQQPTLQHLDLAISAGTHAAFVGPSGAGKSTIVNLLLRFWDPTEGSVIMDGHDLRDVTLTSLRSQIGLVFQDTFVFNSTVRENIAIGRAGATDADVAAAARAARLDTYVASLPAQYDTVLGEHGVRMSGGQRQRLAIARALLRDPRILIFDEATSALDPVTEAEIQQTLEEVGRGRTRITITHRLTSVTGADCVFVLDGGRIVERGTHGELVTAGGLYQRLYEEQTGTDGGDPVRTGIELNALRAVPLFAALDEDRLARIAERMTLERVGPAVEIVRQGEAGDALYVIGQGQVDVSVFDGISDRQVARMGAGEYFGEIALLTGQPRTATVRTVEASTFFVLTREDFLMFAEADPALRNAISLTATGRRAVLAPEAR